MTTKIIVFSVILALIIIHSSNAKRKHKEVSKDVDDDKDNEQIQSEKNEKIEKDKADIKRAQQQLKRDQEKYQKKKERENTKSVKHKSFKEYDSDQEDQDESEDEEKKKVPGKKKGIKVNDKDDEEEEESVPSAKSKKKMTVDEQDEDEDDIKRSKKKKHKKSKLHKDKEDGKKRGNGNEYDEEDDEDFHKKVKKSRSDYYSKNNSTVRDPEKSKGDGDFEPTTVKVEYNEVDDDDDDDDDEEGDDKKGKSEHKKKDDKKDNQIEPDKQYKDYPKQKKKKIVIKDVDGESADNSEKIDITGEHFDNFDKVAGDLYPLGDYHRHGLPDTKKRLTYYCSLADARIAYFQKYVRTRILRQNPLLNGWFIAVLLEIYSTSMKIYIDKWCHDERGLEFIEKAKIVNKSLFKLYRIRKAYLNVLINALQHHNQIQTMNLCCSHYKYLNLTAKAVDPKVSNFVSEMVVHFQSIEIELWCGIISIGSTGCLIINSQNPFKNFIKPYFDAPQYAWVELFIHDLSITRHFRTIIYFLLRMKENGPPQQKDNNHDEDQEDQDDDEEDQDEEVDDDEDEEDENDDKDKRKKKHKTKEETKEKRNKRSTLFES